jgi:hypothetical protein
MVCCADCELPYGGPGWIDAVVPNDVWRQISPTHDEGGILCITCMARRCEALGLEDVPVMLASGPFSWQAYIPHSPPLPSRSN